MLRGGLRRCVHYEVGHRGLWGDDERAAGDRGEQGGGGRVGAEGGRHRELVDHRVQTGQVPKTCFRRGVLGGVVLGGQLGEGGVVICKERNKYLGIFRSRFLNPNRLFMEYYLDLYGFLLHFGKRL